MSTVRMNFDCSELTTQISAVRVFLLNEYGDSVVLVSRTAVFCQLLLRLSGISSDSLLP